VSFGGHRARRLEVDASIVDDSVHPADAVHLIGEFPGLRGAAEVADDDSRGVRGEVAERRRPLAGAGMEDHVMALPHKDLRGSAAEPVGGAGDERYGTRDNSAASGLPVAISCCDDRRQPMSPQRGPAA